MKKGFSNLIIILIVATFIVTVSGGFYYFSSIEKDKPKPIKITPQEKIENAVSEKVDGENKKITHVSGSFIRGEVEINDQLNSFYMIKTGEDWNLFSVSDQPISCERGERVGFPASIISDCLYQSPNAKKSGDIKNKSKEELLSEENIEIIGNLNIGSDPSSGFMITDEDNNSVNINVGNFDPAELNSLDEGDYIVVGVSVSEDEDGELRFLLENTEKIETVSGSNSENISRNSETNRTTESPVFSDDGSDLSEEIYYDITDLPPGYVPDLDAYYKSLIDRDFSGKEIEIISDF